MNSDCESDKACIKEKCVNPCPGSCGLNAVCDVSNHIPICACPESFTGNPFSNCFIKRFRKMLTYSSFRNIL